MELRGHRDVLWRGGWGPNGRRAITASWDYTAQVWSTDIPRLAELVRERLGTVRLEESDLEPFRRLLGDERIAELTGNRR